MATLTDVLSGLASATYNTIEVRSNAAPPVVISMADLQGGGPPNPYAQALQPTIILSGPAGSQTIAPYGVADVNTGWYTSIGSLALIVGLGFVIGRATK